MKKILFIILVTLSVVGCTKKGCKDRNAINYNHNPSVTSDPTSCEFLSNNFNTITIQNGDVTQTTTWGKVAGATVDYYINSTIDINAELVIEPGVIIEFGHSGELVLNSGSLYLMGEENNRIILRNVAESDWKGISISGQNYPNREFHFNYVDIIKASGNDYFEGSINLNDYCDIQLNNVSISGSSNSGLNIFSSDDFIGANFISNLTVSNCERPIVSRTEKILNYMDEIILQNNTNNWIEFPSNNLNFDSTLFPESYPYYFSDSGTKYISKLTANPGAEFIISGGRLYVEGYVTCPGTSTKPIVFRNKTGTSWYGLRVNLIDSPYFNNVNIIGVVNAGSSSAPLYVYNNGGELTFTNCSIQATNVSCGIRFVNSVLNSQFNTAGSSFTGCINDICN